MFIQGVVNADAAPALEATLQFAARRQTLLAHDIANISTPNFRPLDVSPAEFQQALGEAIDRRRAHFGGDRGPLPLSDTRHIHVDPRGRLTLRPHEQAGNILFHDRNNRDLERLMQSLVENTSVFRTAAELLRTHYASIERAIRETT
ncbi:MAG: hypothetical protein D6824_00520 [Planctomycetota bacterium]|nr:MAG: hypothetical protein D6824_00520 [Planctomycetota bacterium]